jgi:5-formyltetrahydrofolate cyclo-ligase
MAKRTDSTFSKSVVREKVWERLQQLRLARFPFPIKGRIPNFKGAEAAVERLTKSAFYQKAKVLKCNPDSPQRPLRQRALEDGKLVFMAVPRLRKEKCFICLDPKQIDREYFRKAASISGAEKFGKPVSPWDMPPIDLIVAGSVAVSESGARVGKGGGYSDIEFAMATQLGLITASTKIISTVHDEQLVDDFWEIMPYDIPLDWIFTPTRSINCRKKHSRPKGIIWDLLKPEMRDGIPVLEKLDTKK